MGTSYGPGITFLAADAELVEEDEGAIAWLLEFAAIGLSRRFRDIVGERVAEFTYDGGEVTWRWLDAAEAAPILEAGPCFGDTHEDWPGAMDHDLFVPNSTAGEPGNVEADGSFVDGWFYTPIEPVVEGLGEALEQIERGDSEADPETVTRLRGWIEFCRTHHLFFVVC
jgi:hypothetical protein